MCASEYARDQYKHNIYHITLYRVLFILASKSHFCVLGFKLKLAPQIFAFVNDRGNHTEMIQEPVNKHSVYKYMFRIYLYHYKNVLYTIINPYQHKHATAPALLTGKQQQHVDMQQTRPGFTFSEIGTKIFCSFSTFHFPLLLDLTTLVITRSGVKRTLPIYYIKLSVCVILNEFM